MKPYLENLTKIIEQGEIVNNDRSGVGTRSMIGLTEQYRLLDGNIPLITTRKVNPNTAIHELIWFLKGNADVTYLRENNVPFWEKWTSDKTNTIGDMYPVLWRNKPEVRKVAIETIPNGKLYNEKVVHIDQLAKLIDGLEKNPESRRHYLSNIAIGNLPDESVSPIENVENGRMALDTCHQVFYVNARKMTEEEVNHAMAYRLEQMRLFSEEDTRPIPEYKLETMLVMRSNDFMVGRPHNIFQYAMLTFILAHALNMHPGQYTHVVNDSHVYSSHLEQAKEQLKREPFEPPKLYLSPKLDKETLLAGDLSIGMFCIKDYQCHDFIRYSLEG